MTFKLTRKCPDGKTREQRNIPSRYKTGQAAFFVLMDNGATRDRLAAAQVGHDVERAKPGETVEAFGYAFTVEKEG